MASATSQRVQCVVVTPERAVVDEAVDFVAVPMYDGELGILHGRAPMMGRLGCGELRIRQGDNVKRFFVDGGFVQVRSSVVTVLTQKAIPAEEIKPDLVVQTLQHSLETPAARGENPDVRLKTQQRARAQIAIARKVQG